jgi:hypothetical protein
MPLNSISGIRELKMRPRRSSFRSNSNDTERSLLKKQMHVRYSADVAIR